MNINIKQRLQKWIGVVSLIQDISKLEKKVSALQQIFDDQMKMVGLDIYLGRQGYNKKGVQTAIIFVSRLGPDKGGSVRIVDADFRDYGELRDFVKFCESSLMQRPIIDAPIGTADMLLDFRRG